MRRILLAILADAAAVVLRLAGTVLFPRRPAWVLWVGVADETDPSVRWDQCRRDLRPEGR